MNEPPIASPFGSPPPKKLVRKAIAPPPLLTTLVAVQILDWLVTSLADAYWLRPGSSVQEEIVTAVIASIFLLPLLVGLLRRSKICWWIFQLLSVYTIIPSVSDYQHAYPAPIEWFSTAAWIALFIYLFTPQARHFFFSKASEFSE